MKISKIEFDALYERYKKPLITYSQRIVYCPLKAEDIVQEVFLRLFKQDFKKIEAHIRAWLFLVCRNLSIKTAQREKKYIDLPQEDYENLVSDENNPFQELDLIDQKKALKNNLKNLSKMQKEAVTLKFFKDLSNEQIAKKLKIKINSVYFNVCKGSQNLKHLITQEMSK